MTTGEPSRVFPAPPARVSPVRGAIDFHVHAHPDVFDRSAADDAVAALAALRQMGGLCSSSSPRAWAPRRWT